MENKQYYQTLYLEMINCPLCDSDSFTELCKRDRYNMDLQTVGCNDCGMIFLNPRPSAESMSNFYRNDYRKFYESVDKPTDSYIQQGPFIPRARFVVEQLKKVVPNNKNLCLLDIGTAEGTLLKLVKESFPEIKTYGIEPGLEFGTYAKEHSGAENIALKTFDEFFRDNTERYDIITLCHVLEHILDPSTLLTEIRNHLSDDGFMYIEVPNILNKRVRGLGNIHIGHVMSFYPDTLRSLLKKTGFDEIELIEDGLPAKTPAMAAICSKGPIGQVDRQSKKNINSNFREYKTNICLTKSKGNFWQQLVE